MTITSAATSRNQIPALHRALGAQLGPINLDLGGGKWDKASRWLDEEHNVINLILDPYNQPADHNEVIYSHLLEIDGADSCTLANVLNVIQDACDRWVVLQQAKTMTRHGGPIYISVYEGDRSGEGRETRDGWQENRRVASYLDEVRQVFPMARVVLGIIVAVNDCV